MPVLTQPTIDRIYNDTVDELHRMFSKDGFTLFQDDQYYEKVTDKNVVWVNDTKGKAYKFCWDTQNEETQLYVAGYTEGYEPEELDWEYLDSVFCGYEDLTNDELGDIVKANIRLYQAVKDRGVEVPDKPGAKPKLEKVLMKAITSVGGIATLWFLLKTLLRIID